MNKLDLLSKYLIQQNESLGKAIEKAKEARDNAPSAMESASDTRRSQSEKLVVALEDQLKEVNTFAKNIDPSNLLYLEVKMGSEIKNFLIVPKGLGGVEIDGVRLLSADTPLGLLLAGKKVGDKFEFNNQSLEILTIE